jgi:hypothetical protein
MTPEDFPQVFARGWELPKPDAFLDYFLPLISPTATFTQPMYPPAHGHAEISQLFRGLFTLMPDMSAVPHVHAVHDATVFIESDCSANLGGKPISFAVCDRFTIQQGQITERCSFSDPLPVALATLRRPSAWPRLLASRRRNL